MRKAAWGEISFKRATEKYRDTNDLKIKNDKFKSRISNISIMILWKTENFCRNLHSSMVN